MNIFYKASHKELLKLRNTIFKDNCMPILIKKGFEKSPFSSDWFGYYPNHGFFYNFVRMNGSYFETIKVEISRGDKWIKFFLNVIEILPNLTSINDLIGKDSLKFKLPPISLTEMRLVTESFEGMPLLNYRFMFNNHKLKMYFTKTGLNIRLDQLTKLIQTDLKNLNFFIDFWHKKYKPFQTNQNGELIGLEKMTVNERLDHIGFKEEFEKSLKNNKERARYMLEWINVDEKSINEILE